jgi:hypothetical protein
MHPANASGVRVNQAVMCKWPYRRNEGEINDRCGGVWAWRVNGIGWYICQYLVSAFLVGTCSGGRPSDAVRRCGWGGREIGKTMRIVGEMSSLEGEHFRYSKIKEIMRQA